MKIAIANDHRGYKLKTKLVKYLTKKGHEIINVGTDSESSVDYPTYAFLLGDQVATGECELGIAICGSGIGISIACNKVKGIRCAKLNNVKEAKYSRIDNDANIMAISGTMPYFRALDIVDTFINTKHLMIERHDKRINMITEYENVQKRRIIKKKVEDDWYDI